MNLEEQIRAYKEIGEQIDELEQQRKELGLAIMEQMQEKTVRVAGYVVRRCNRLSIKMSIEEARIFGAVKMEETVDKAKIKELYQQGETIGGVSEIQYIQVSEASKIISN